MSHCINDQFKNGSSLMNTGVHLSVAHRFWRMPVYGLTLGTHKMAKLLFNCLLICLLFPTAVKAASLDYGDAPSDLSFIDADMNPAYPTLIADSAASHAVDGVTFLGAGVSVEVDGQPNTEANGDDDDGVTFPTLGGRDVLITTQSNTIDISASVPGFLNTWIDYNQDGDWGDNGEHIFNNTALSAGSNSLTITPSDRQPTGDTYLRFRFTSATVATPVPTGALPDGEVEDYKVAIVHPEPQGCISGLINGDFEVSKRSYFVNENVMEGWATLPNDPAFGTGFSYRNKIEGWNDGKAGVPAFEGGYFVEINANVPGTLYQDIQTTPGSVVNIEFAHRGRQGNDTVDTLAGAPGSESITTGGVGFTTSNTGWAEYSTTYTVPAGQHITRFGFKAISSNSGSGNPSTGNFIDAVQLTYDDACNTSPTLTVDDATAIEGNNLTHTVTLS